MSNLKLSWHLFSDSLAMLIRQIECWLGTAKSKCFQTNSGSFTILRWNRIAYRLSNWHKRDAGASWLTDWLMHQPTIITSDQLPTIPPAQQTNWLTIRTIYWLTDCKWPTERPTDGINYWLYNYEYLHKIGNVQHKSRK